MCPSANSCGSRTSTRSMEPSASPRFTSSRSRSTTLELTMLIPPSAAPSTAADIGDLDGNGGPAAVPLDQELQAPADADALQFLGEIGQAPHRPAVDADDDVADLAGAGIDPAQPRAGRGRARQRPHDHH